MSALLLVPQGLPSRHFRFHRPARGNLLAWTSVVSFWPLTLPCDPAQRARWGPSGCGKGCSRLSTRSMNCETIYCLYVKLYIYIIRYHTIYTMKYVYIYRHIECVSLHIYIYTLYAYSYMYTCKIMLRMANIGQPFLFFHSWLWYGWFLSRAPHGPIYAGLGPSLVSGLMPGDLVPWRRMAASGWPWLDPCA